jgi:hypothetical protein
MSPERVEPLAERPLAWWTVPLGVVAAVAGGFALELASPHGWRPAQAVENTVQLGVLATWCTLSLALADEIGGTSRRPWAWPVATALAAAVASLGDAGPVVPSRILHVVRLHFQLREVISGALLGACLGLAFSVAARSGTGRLWKLPAAGSMGVAVAILVLFSAWHAWRWLGPSDAAWMVALCIAMGGLPGLVVALGLRSRPHEPEPDR